MSDDLVLGYSGALIAVFFFGTCYVPAKQYPTYGKPAAHILWLGWDLMPVTLLDGIIFQWFMVRSSRVSVRFARPSNLSLCLLL